MSRESRAIPKMIGLENEYGCIDRNLPPSLAPEYSGFQFVRDFNPAWFSLGKSGSWDASERLFGLKDKDAEGHPYFKDKIWLDTNFLLPNGARFYCDLSHPEICIPICRNAEEALLHDRACEWLMNHIRLKHKEEYGHDFVLYKNNTAYGYDDDEDEPGVSFSTHENYLVSRSVDTKYLYSRVLPFLVIRTAMIGAGRVGGFRTYGNANYQISQRADFFGRTHGVDTMGPLRPIYNLRDRPYADPYRFRRLHVICGDANMCDMAEFLKFTTMQVLLMMIEDGFLDRRFDLVDPVEEFHGISSDINFQRKLILADNSPSRTVLELLQEYIGLMSEYLEVFSINDPVLRMGINEADRVSRLLSDDPESLFGEIDHITKRMLIQRAIEKGKISSWKDPNAKVMDMKYHNINRNESLFYRKGVYDKKRFFSDSEIAKAAFEPPLTRSRFQVEVQKRFGLLGWDWRHMYIFDGSGNEVDPIVLDDPTVEWSKLENLLCDDRDEFIGRLREAGMLEKIHNRITGDEDLDSVISDMRRMRELKGYYRHYVRYPLREVSTQDTIDLLSGPENKKFLDLFLKDIDNKKKGE